MLIKSIDSISIEGGMDIFVEIETGYTYIY